MIDSLFLKDVKAAPRNKIIYSKNIKQKFSLRIFVGTQSNGSRKEEFLLDEDKFKCFFFLLI